MILYPQNIESKLGFDKIKNLVIDNCTSDLGKSGAILMRPQADFDAINRLLEETLEQKRQLMGGETFPELRAFQINKHLDHVHVEGFQLEAETLFQLKSNLDITHKCLQYFGKKKEDYPLWAANSQKIMVPLDLIKALDQVFDKHGNIKDGASRELKRLRQDISQNETKVRKNLESLLRKARSDGFTEKESALTIREGRLVLPLHAEYKRKIKGLVVDESATGKTVYLEPLEVFNLNNTIRELQFAEKREILKILTALTAALSPHKESIRGCQKYLEHLDFSRAKGRVAIKLDAHKPDFSDSCQFNLKNARHPLLQLAHQKLNLPVVPLDIHLDQETRVMVISGPNAGGKSVCLKTIGLLQMMCQSGMLVPANEDSTVGCFQKLFVEIGDEQSIENDLSTYSSHLRNMDHFVRHSQGKTLFLIDEFGTGTEPQFGGPIAEAILNYLVQQGSFGIVTTHYSNLKKFAERTPKVINAAMRFDLQKLEPLFALEPGRPGSSFALEIAAKTGLPGDILKEAKGLIGEDPVAFEKLISQLEQAKQQHLKGLNELQKLREDLQKQQQNYHDLSSELKEQKRALIQQAREEATELLSQANQKIESTIRAIKESKADKDITRIARNDLDRFKKRIQPKEVIREPKEQKFLPGSVKVGDWVKIKASQAEGEVLKVSGSSAQVRLGFLKSNIKLNRLQRIKKAPGKAASGEQARGFQLYRKRSHYSSELDVRGMRAEQALKAVTDFIDEGVMLGMGNLRIIHGRGDGILRELIQKYLIGAPGVQAINDEAAEKGGDGVTLISLQ